MSSLTLLTLLVAGAVLLGGPGACGAQSGAYRTPAQRSADALCPGHGQASGNDPARSCTAPTGDVRKPSVAEQFPFPGGSGSSSETPDAPAPASNPGASSTGNAASKAAQPSAAAEHPFPGEGSGETPSRGSGSSPSSSSSSDDAVDSAAPIGPPLHDEGSESRSTRRKLPKVHKVQTDDERVDEDISVARFYVNDGNLGGAYLRAKDAVKVEPEYSEAHYTLGEIALKLKKKDEAIAEFNTYLKLDPKGEKIKAVQRALSQLQ